MTVDIKGLIAQYQINESEMSQDQVFRCPCSKPTSLASLPDALKNIIISSYLTDSDVVRAKFPVDRYNAVLAKREQQYAKEEEWMKSDPKFEYGKIGTGLIPEYAVEHERRRFITGEGYADDDMVDSGDYIRADSTIAYYEKYGYITLTAYCAYFINANRGVIISYGAEEIVNFKIDSTNEREDGIESSRFDRLLKEVCLPSPHKLPLLIWHALRRRFSNLIPKSLEEESRLIDGHDVLFQIWLYSLRFSLRQFLDNNRPAVQDIAGILKRCVQRTSDPKIFEMLFDYLTKNGEGQQVINRAEELYKSAFCRNIPEVALYFSRKFNIKSIPYGCINTQNYIYNIEALYNEGIPIGTKNLIYALSFRHLNSVRILLDMNLVEEPFSDGTPFRIKIKSVLDTKPLITYPPDRDEEIILRDKIKAKYGTV